MLKNISKKIFLIVSVTFAINSYTKSLSAQDEKIDPYIDRFNKRIDILELEEDKNKASIRRLLEDVDGSDKHKDNPKDEEYASPIELDLANTKLVLGGFVQTDLIYDFNTNNIGPAFVPSTIPVSRKNIHKLAFSFLQTRFTLQSQTYTSLGLLKTLFEYDLFGNNGPGFHVRHAWGEIGRFGAGQYWSVFMDIDVFPNILDYQGPNAMVFVRQPQIRYTHPINNNFKIAISLEAPNSDLLLKNNIYSKNSLAPDFAMQFRYENKGSHLQLAGLLHSVSYIDDKLTSFSKVGWGLNLTGSYLLSEKINNRLMFGAAVGKGIARYFNDVSGLGYDGVITTNTVDLLSIWSLMAFYNHNWSSKFSSSIGWAFLDLENNPLQLEGAFNHSNYGVANIIYYPAKPIKVGLEYLYGAVNNKNNKTGYNNRFQLSVMYKF